MTSIPRPFAVLLSIGLLLSGLGLGAAQPAQAASNPVHTGGGLLVPSKKIAPKVTAKYTRQALGGSVLPVSADLTQYAVTPGDQGTVNSCVSWAIAHTLMGWYANKAGTPESFAPMYIYTQTHISDEPGDGGGGSYAQDAYNVTYSQGVDTAVHYTPGGYDYQTKPTAEQTANAAQYKTSAATTLFTDSRGAGTAGMTAIKQALATGTPVAIGMQLYDGFERLDANDYTWHEADGGANEGGHYLIALGYNSTGLLVENSWGTTWGNKGYAILGWDYVTKEVFEAETITGFQNALPEPVYTAPSAVSGFKALHATDTSIKLAWGEPASNGGKNLTGYTVTYTDKRTTKTMQIAPDVQIITPGWLKPDTAYTFTVTANNDLGASPPISVVSRTKAGYPVNKGVKIKSAKRAFTMTWQAAQPNAAGIQHYRIAVKHGAITKKYTVGDTRHSLTVGSLLPKTRYQVTFTVTNTSGKLSNTVYSVNTR